MLKKILEWSGVFWCAMFAIYAFANGGIIGGIIFLLLAFICSPYRYLLLDLLPEKFKKKAIVVTASVVLFCAGCLGVPTDSSSEPTEEVVEEVVETETTKDIAAVTQEDEKSDALEETKDIEEAKDTSEKEAKIEEDNSKKEEKTKAEKTTTNSSETSTASDSSTKQFEVKQDITSDSATREIPSETAAQTVTEEVPAQQAAPQPAPQVNSSTTANGTESANALKVLQMGPTTGNPCWVPRNGGQKYHTDSSCSGMIDPIYTTVDTATACGFDACKRCH